MVRCGSDLDSDSSVGGDVTLQGAAADEDVDADVGEDEDVATAEAWVQKNAR